MSDRSFSSHAPRALRVLLITQFGERLAGSLLLALLTMYLTEHFRWSIATALRAVGLFVGLGYALTMPGGLWADRRRGHAEAVLFGCVLLISGYVLLVFDSTSACLAGLLLLALGSGLFRPSILALVAARYKHDDTRRQSGFSALYASANLGALVAPPLGEWLRRNYCWSAAFVMAAFIQLLTTSYFFFEWKQPQTLNSDSSGARFLPPSASQTAKQPLIDDRSRIHALLLFLSAATWFWIAVQQSNGTLVLFARDQTDRFVKNIFSERRLFWEIPVGWFSSAHAALVILLAALQSPLLAFLSKRGRNRALFQLALGMFLLAVAYAIWSGACLSYVGERVPVLWLILGYLALAMAEFLVGPLSYAFIAEYAPPKHLGLLLGVSLLGTAVGSLLAGELGARFWASTPHQVFFGAGALISFLVAVTILLMQTRLGPSSG